MSPICDDFETITRISDGYLIILSSYLTIIQCYNIYQHAIITTPRRIEILASSAGVLTWYT
jgi:hypothetical protein